VTAVSAPCPVCSSKIEFRRNDRAQRVTGRCLNCASDFTLSPAGVVADEHGDIAARDQSIE
jgi:phage/plasmid primase-like uncharacterized protein